MNKFTIAGLPESGVDYNDNQPSLYEIWFGNKYYIHKSKKLKDGVDRFLDDVDRGMRDKSCPEHYFNVVQYCKKYPAVHKVSVQLIINSEPAKLLRKEVSALKEAKGDDNCLNRFDIPPIKPEWMQRVIYQERCEKCATSGVIEGKKAKFKFCPNCGRVNK